MPRPREAKHLVDGGDLSQEGFPGLHAPILMLRPSRVNNSTRGSDGGPSVGGAAFRL